MKIKSYGKFNLTLEVFHKNKKVVVKMINLLSENSNWDKVFSFIFDVFLFIFDVIWNTKLPMTNTMIIYFIIFFMVFKLYIYAIQGTIIQYNELGSTTQSGV